MPSVTSWKTRNRLFSQLFGFFPKNAYLCKQLRKMKKILFINSKRPCPIIDGASIGTFQYLELFHKLGYETDLLYISENEDLDIVNKGIGPLCHRIIHFRRTKTQSFLSVIKGFLCNLLPIQVNYYYSSRIQKWINAHYQDYDIIYCHNLRTAEYARHLPKYKILNIVDSFSMNYENAKAKARGLWHWIYAIDAIRCAKYEQVLLGVFDKKLIVSEVDCDFIAKRAQHPVDICVIENSVEVDEGKRIDNNPEEHNLVFVGAMNYEPNITAVKHFCQHIMPAIVNAFPDVMFYIVGKTPSPDVQALSSENVIVTGFVDDIWTYLKKASVVVAPMLSGSGIQNKVLQALAVGACVVTTPDGFGGLKSDVGQPFVAENDADMIKCITDLLAHPDSRRLRGELSIQYVKRHYSKDVICKKFKDFLDS